MSWVFGPGGGATPGGADKDIQFNNNGSFSGSAKLTTDGSGSLSASTHVSASTYYGDGSNLTGLTASAVNVADGPEYSIQFRRDAPVSGEISGSVNFRTNAARSSVFLTGTLIVSGATAANIEGPVIITSPEGKLEVQDTTNNFQVTLVPAVAPKVQFGTIADEDQYMSIDGGNTNRIITNNDFFIATSSTYNQGLYYDVSVERIGVNTSAPTHDFTVNGDTFVTGAISASIGISSSQVEVGSAFVGDVSANGVVVGFTGGRLISHGNFTFASDVLAVPTITASVGISSSVLIVNPTSGSLAGGGSYLGLNTNNQVVITSSAGGGGTPGGANTQVQFNDGGSFGADSTFTFAKTTNVLSVPTVTASVGVMVTSSTNGSINIGEGISYTFGGNGRLDVFENEFKLNKTNLYQAMFPEQTSNFNIGDSQVFLVDTRGSVVTGTLPGVNSSDDVGITYTIKDSGGNAGTNDIIIEPSGSQKIDGATAAKIASPYGAMTVVSLSSSVNGFGWGIISVT